jgi:hypothetical protein
MRLHEAGTPIEDIDYDLLRVRIAEKLADGWRCPLCQKPDAWGGADVVAKLPVALYEAQHRAVPPPGNVRIDKATGEPIVYVVGIFCQHCGFSPLLQVDALLAGEDPH